MVRLVFTQIALGHKWRSRRSCVGEEKVNATIVIVVADPDSHWVAIDVRAWILNVFERHVSVVSPGSNLTRVVSDNKIFIGVTINIVKHGLECVVLVVHPGVFSFVSKSVVAVVDQQGTSSAIAFFVENVVAFNPFFLDIATNIHVEVTVAIQVSDRNRKRRCVVVERHIEFLPGKFSTVVCIKPDACFASHDQVIITVMVNVQ